MQTCSRHPRYRGKKKPKTDCWDCAAIYLQMKGTRKPVPPPSKRHKDKSKYDRKAKKKEPTDE